MANYPQLPIYNAVRNMSTEDLYREIRQFADLLAYELNTRDIQVDTRPATKVYSVVTVTDIGRPSPGDIAFSLDEEKFKGYVSSTGWVDLN
jgi:hypothetical protein